MHDLHSHAAPRMTASQGKLQRSTKPLFHEGVLLGKGSGHVMDIDQLAYLVAVEEHGSILAASKHAHITQPSMSRSLRRLERELGHELFVRRSNKVELNGAGKLAVRHAREILEARERLDRDLADLERVERSLRVGSIAPAPTWNLTARVIERFPGTILEADMMDEDSIEARLLDGTIDLAISRRPSPIPSIACVPLMTEHLFLSAPSDSPLARAEWVTWKDLNGKRFLLYELIGFWKGLVIDKLPDSEFVMQKDREVFLQLVEGSDLLAFTTDAPQNRGFPDDRTSVPIRDADAHATFYVLALMGAPPRVTEIVDWIRDD